MTYEERPLCFACRGSALYGILSMPQLARAHGILIVVGGPQYRAGSHRQFVLLARELATHGYPVLRFDYRGMGDSEGEQRNFEQIDDDLRTAVDQFFSAVPSLRKVVIWGLCDGASAALFYAHQDARVGGLVLVNPWAHTEAGEAKARLQHYYRARLLDAEFWKKIAHGDFNVGAAARSLWNVFVHSRARPTSDSGLDQSLPERLYRGWSAFKGEVLLVLSGNDLTAQEFQGLIQRSPQWSKLVRSPHVHRFDLPDANHTFSRREWREQLIGQLLAWLSESRISV